MPDVYIYPTLMADIDGHHMISANHPTLSFLWVFASERCETECRRVNQRVVLDLWKEVV